MLNKRVYKPAKANYPFRAFGLLLASFGMALINPESHSRVEWAIFGFYGLLWPHLAYLHTRVVSDARSAERMNLRLDCFFLGFLLYIIEFNPVLILLSIGLFSLDRGLAYGWRFAIECLSLEFVAAGLCAVVFGLDFTVAYEVNLASVPFVIVVGLMLFYGLMIGNSGNINIKKIRASRKEIESLNLQIKEQVLIRYLPPDLINDIFDGKMTMDTKPHSQQITVLFSDLSGFTKMSEKHGAEVVAEFLNDYLTLMNETIFEHKGTIDKFIGDAIMVIFGAPRPMSEQEQAQNACKCASAMQAMMWLINKEWKTKGVEEVSMRIGIHQGKAVVGNFGSKQRVDYTAIGPSVNLASRIETACKPGSIYISEEVRALLGSDLPSDLAGEFELKGIEGKTSLYKLVEWG